MKNIQHFKGSILGLAIGDALGYPCEFRTRQQIFETFPGGIKTFVGLHDDIWPARPIIIGSGEMPPGTFSDDTQMTLALAEGLLAENHSLDEAMTEVGRAFVKWSVSPKNNRAPGGTCMTGCEALAKGIHWTRSGVQQSKGCGSAMRVAPIGLLFHNDLDRLVDYAKASSVMTHGHPAGIDGAVSAALLVASALNGESVETMFESVNRYCHSTDFRTLWNRMPEYFDWTPSKVLVEGVLGESWIAEEAVASAFYCYQRAQDNFSEVVLVAANTDGDSDSIACIAGSIAGAALGINAIPDDWVEEVEDSEYLKEISDRLFIKSQSNSNLSY